MKMKIKSKGNKYSEKWWKSQLTHVEEKRKKFIENAEESIRVFNAQKQAISLSDAERKLNVWWYIINTLVPAFYSSTPKAEVNLKKRTGGIPHELGAVVLERNTQYAMDTHFDFDQVGYQAALQWLLTGQSVLWSRYVPKFQTVMQEIALIKDPSGQLFDAQGNIFDGDTTNAKEQGNILIVSTEIEQKVSEKAILEIVQYNDYFCSDARTESEIEWQARRAFLDREQAESMFGSDVADELSYDSFPEVIKKDIARKDDKFEGKAEVYEIWCEASNKVYWLQKSGDKCIIETSEPPIKFEKFYPCSVVRQSLDPDSVIPISDFAHCKDQILEVERLTTRIHAVTQAIRTNTLYDATLGNQVEQLMTGDLKLIPVTNWPSYKTRGGISSGMETMNIEAYVKALQVLQTARTSALEQLYETLKVSDLLRGTSEQYKSATASRLENQWSSLGLIVRQNMFCKFVSDAISNLGTIIAEQFDENTLFEIGDADGLLAPLVQEPPPQEMPPQDPNAPVEAVAPSPMAMFPSPEEQIMQMKAQILDILRDPTKRSYRIHITSDSMVAIDQAQQQQEAATLIQGAGAFFDQMRGLITEYPPLLGFSIAFFQNMIKRYKGGKELDGIFTSALNQIGEIARAKEEAAKQPPPPDPKMQEMQGRLQIAQIEAEARLQVTQIQSQDAQTKNIIANQEMQVRMQKEQLAAQLDMQKAQLEQYIAEQELALKQQELQIKASSVQVEMAKVQAMASSEQTKNDIKAESVRLTGLLEVQKLEAQQMEFRLSQQEKLMEERRLAAEQQLEAIRIQMEKTATIPKEVSSPTPIVINNVIPKQGKRRASMISDELGNIAGIELDNVDEETQG